MKKLSIPVLFGFAAVSVARIASGNDIAAENYGAISLDQTNGTVTTAYGTNGCAPTAATMGFQYLQSTFGITSLVNNGSPYSTVVTVGNGSNMKTSSVTATSGDNMFSGAQSYLNAQAPGQTTVQKQIAPLVDSGSLSNTVPTEPFIFGKLQTGWAVQVGVLWVPTAGNTLPANFTGNGGHALTITGINWSNTTNTGTLSILDPGGGSPITGNLSLVTNSGVTQAGWNTTFLQFTYPGPTGGAESDGVVTAEEANSSATEAFGAGGAIGDIAVAVAEIPEPASGAILLGIAAVGLLRRGRKIVIAG